MEHIAKHRNGGARVKGTQCHVSSDSFCDALSRIEDGSQVFHSSLLASQVCRSTILNSTLIGLRAQDCVLDGVRVVGGVDLDNVVAENCELRGIWRLSGIARIPTGIWNRAPRFIEIKGESIVPGHEVHAGITESTDDHALIACLRKPIVRWLRAGPRLGRMLGWPSGQVKEAVDFFTMLLDCPVET